MATKRTQTWVQKVPKKGSKSELLKKSKIELSLQSSIQHVRRHAKWDLKTGLLTESIEMKLAKPKRTP